MLPFLEYSRISQQMYSRKIPAAPPCPSTHWSLACFWISCKWNPAVHPLACQACSLSIRRSRSFQGATPFSSSLPCTPMQHPTHPSACASFPLVDARRDLPWWMSCYQQACSGLCVSVLPVSLTEDLGAVEFRGRGVWIMTDTVRSASSLS